MINKSSQALVDFRLLIFYEKDVNTVELGKIQSEQSKKAFLPNNFGEATLKYTFESNQKRVEGSCGYVEKTMYFATIEIDSAMEHQCRVKLFSLSL